MPCFVLYAAISAVVILFLYYKEYGELTIADLSLYILTGWLILPFVVFDYMFGCSCRIGKIVILKRK